MAGQSIAVLLIDDDREDAMLVWEALRKAKLVRFSVEYATRLADGLERLAREGIDVVLLDLGLPDSRGIETFVRAHDCVPDMPIVVLTGLADEAVGLEAVRRGAADYLVKGQASHDLLARSIHYAWERRQAEKALRASEMEYRDLYDGAPVGYHEIDSEGRLTRVNRTELLMLGYRAEEMLGRPVWEFLVESEESQRMVRAKLEGSHPPANGLARMYRRKDGSTVPVLIDERVLTDDQDKVVGIRSVLRDATERQAAEETRRQHVTHLGKMVQITAQLAREKDTDALCQKAVELARTELGIDRLGVLLAVPGRERLQGTFGTDEDGRTRDERRYSLDPAGDSLIGSVLHGKAPFVAREMVWPDRDGRVRSHGWNVVVPLVGRDQRILGILSADSLLTGKVFEEHLLQILRLYGTSFGHLLEGLWTDKAQRTIQTELQTARRIQQGLLPKRAPEVPGFEIAGSSYPAAATGGDYYDYLALPDGSLGFVVGDVMGHGLGAALLAADTCAYTRAFARSSADLSHLLTQTNRLLIEDMNAEGFVALTLVRLDPAARTLHYANAGQISGYLLDAAGRLKAILDSTDSVLGVDPEGEFCTAGPIPLKPGDLLCLVTDGVSEAFSPADEPFGSERILGTLRASQHKPPRQIIDDLWSAVRVYRGGQPLMDDVTVVIIKCMGQAES